MSTKAGGSLLCSRFVLFCFLVCGSSFVVDQLRKTITAHFSIISFQFSSSPSSDHHPLNLFFPSPYFCCLLLPYLLCWLRATLITTSRHGSQLARPVVFVFSFLASLFFIFSFLAHPQTRSHFFSSFNSTLSFHGWQFVNKNSRRKDDVFLNETAGVFFHTLTQPDQSVRLSWSLSPVPSSPFVCHPHTVVFRQCRFQTLRQQQQMQPEVTVKMAFLCRRLLLCHLQ